MVRTKVCYAQHARSFGVGQAAESEVRELMERMSPLHAQLEAARERLDLIHRLIRVSGGNNTIAHLAPQEGHKEADGDRRLRTESQFRFSALEEHVEDLLRKAKQPLHIAKIREALVERGVPLPGRGDEANIIVRLRRNETRFTRTGRGVYGLSEWKMEAVPPAKRTVKRRRR